MTDRRRAVREPLGSWPERAACKGAPYFTEWALFESDKVCAVCPVQRKCRKAGLMPRQIQAMP